MVVIP